MLISDVEEVVNKYMLLEDKGVVKLLCAFVIAQRMDLLPPWLFIVGSSSGGKSMLLSALADVKGYFPLDDLTSNTFASGQQKKKGDAQAASLLDEFTDHTFITMKDFTTILGKDKESRGVIISQLRKIYDGDFVKRYGNGVEVNYKGKLGLLAGTTTKIYTTWGQYADMGERFLMYYFKQPDRLKVAMRVMNSFDDREAAEKMREAFRVYLDEDLFIPNQIPQVDEEAKMDLIQLADLATRARSGVERDAYSRNKDMQFAHDPEMPMRFLKQLQSLAIGFLVINGDGKLTPNDRKTLYQIALDSIPRQRRIVLDALTHYDNVDHMALAGALGYPSDTVKNWLEDLRALKVISSYRDFNKKQFFKLNPEYRETLSKFEGIEMTSEELKVAVGDDLFAD